MSVADRRLKITRVAIENPAHLFADCAILGTNLATQATVGTTEDRAAFAVRLCLARIDMLEIAAQSIQRWNGSGKDLVHPRLLPPPICFQRFDRELRL